MATKKYDAVVKTGEYTDRSGQTKARYENIGTVMVGDNGPYLILKRTFNPAGVPNPDNRDSLLVSFFEPRDEQQQAPRPQASRPQAAPASAGNVKDDDIPF